MPVESAPCESSWFVDKPNAWNVRRGFLEIKRSTSASFAYIRHSKIKNSCVSQNEPSSIRAFFREPFCAFRFPIQASTVIGVS